MENRKDPGKKITAALAGNPNSGKTTLFNRLTGSSASVGNWPGVTVERKTGTARLGKTAFSVTDLPGVYSLLPYTPEEALTGRFLKTETPDVIINVVDAANLERNLYLTTQLMELGVPLVAAFTMTDVARRRGDSIDYRLLSVLLGFPVIPVRAADGEGLQELMKAAERVSGTAPRCRHVFQPDGPCRDPDLRMAQERYRYIGSTVSKAVRRREKRGPSLTERIDRVATSRVFAIPLFFLIVFAVFFLTFGPPGGVLVGLTEKLVNGASAFAARRLAEAGTSRFTSGLILNGVFAGVGAVVKFLPQILLLFTLLSLLEDSGYMARTAFIMDAPMRKIGLSGRSFVPLLMGFGCTVPAAMSTRILENEKDKKLTILMLPFLSCSAKLPVYTLIIAAFFGRFRSIVLFLLYAFGVLTGILSTLFFKSFFLKGDPAPFVMELPDYRLPTIENICRHVGRRMKDFLQRAGTVVFAASVTVWLLSSVSGRGFLDGDNSQSLLAAAGRAVAPVFSLCGFGSWQAAVSLLTGLAAKESIAGVLGVLCSGNLTEGLRGIFTPLSSCSFLIFVLLYTPCSAALAAIRRETGSAALTVFCALYQFITAWYASALFYQCALLVLRLTGRM